VPQRTSCVFNTNRPYSKKPQFTPPETYLSTDTNGDFKIQVKTNKSIPTDKEHATKHYTQTTNKVLIKDSTT